MFMHKHKNTFFANYEHSNQKDSQNISEYVLY